VNIVEKSSRKRRYGINNKDESVDSMHLDWWLFVGAQQPVEHSSQRQVQRQNQQQHLATFTPALQSRTPHTCVPSTQYSFGS